MVCRERSWKRDDNSVSEALYELSTCNGIYFDEIKKKPFSLTVDSNNFRFLETRTLAKCGRLIFKFALICKPTDKD